MSSCCPSSGPASKGMEQVSNGCGSSSTSTSNGSAHGSAKDSAVPNSKGCQPVSNNCGTTANGCGTTAKACGAGFSSTDSGPTKDGVAANGVHDNVKNYYGKVLTTSKDLKTNACTAAGAPHPLLKEAIRRIPDPVVSQFYGCGTPIPLGISGLRVLDLGSGSGRDCYICAALVGEQGSVVGVDMTPSQLEVAERHAAEYCASLGYAAPNMRFVEGYMEDLAAAGIPDESADIIISNCVVNLSPDKKRVLEEAYRVLAPGGEFYFSDVYTDRRVPEAAKNDKVLWGECISGALYLNDFMRMARAAGFTAPLMHSAPAPISIKDVRMRALLGNLRAYSITFRLFKLPGLLELDAEDYGQGVIYKGTIPGHEQEYRLDQDNVFEKGRLVTVSGNVAACLGAGGISWLAPHFSVIGDRSTHFGAFGKADAGAPFPSVVEEASGGCC